RLFGNESRSYGELGWRASSGQRGADRAATAAEHILARIRGNEGGAVVDQHEVPLHLTRRCRADRLDVAGVQLDIHYGGYFCCMRNLARQRRADHVPTRLSGGGLVCASG